MNKILTMLGTNNYKILDYDKLLPGDIFTSPKNDLIGIVLRNDCLLMKAKAWKSFRVKFANIQLYGPFAIRRNREKIDHIDFDEYFAGNSDNPYALYHVLQCVLNKCSLSSLTQFPPLFFNKARVNRLDELKTMESIADVGDTVFMYTRNSRVSNLIRKVDKGPWAHLGMVGENKTISHLTTHGMRFAKFGDFLDENIDIALYRFNVPLNQGKKTKILEIIAQQHVSNPKYSWIKVVAIVLRKTLKIPIPIPVTPSNIIYSNHLRLLHYC